MNQRMDLERRCMRATARRVPGKFFHKKYSVPKASAAATYSRSLSGRAALDALFVLGALENGVHENAGSMNLVRQELARLDKFFDFGDDIIGGRGHHGIEIARGFSVDEVAPAVALPRLDERKIAAQAALHDTHAAVEFAGFFSFGDHGAVARERVERGNAGAAGAKAFAECTLRIEFHLQLATEDQLLEEFVLADIGGDHFFDLALLEEQANAEVIDACVVADDGEVFCSFAADGGDKIFRDAAEAEAAHQDGGAVFKVRNAGVSRGDAFVHGEWSVIGS